MFRKAFTLMEVNLAILVMAGGILSIVSLYSLGYRESAQSQEDVEAAAFADLLLGKAAMALSDTNLEWSVFNELPNLPSDRGWADYLDSQGRVSRGDGRAVLDHIAQAGGKSGVKFGDVQPPEDLKAWGLVLRHERNSPVVSIAFRAAKRKSMLMSAPLFYTSVVFQGRQQNR